MPLLLCFGGGGFWLLITGSVVFDVHCAAVVVVGFSGFLGLGLGLGARLIVAVDEAEVARRRQRYSRRRISLLGRCLFAAADAAAWRRSGPHSLRLVFGCGESYGFRGLVLAVDGGFYGVELRARLVVVIDTAGIFRRRQRCCSISGMGLLVGSACFNFCSWFAERPVGGVDDGQTGFEVCLRVAERPVVGAYAE